MPPSGKEPIPMADRPTPPAAAGADPTTGQGRGGPGPSADDVLAALVGATGEAVELLRRVVRGDAAAEGIGLERLETIGSAEAARVDAAKFVLGHAAPLLAELRALRAGVVLAPDQPL